MPLEAAQSSPGFYENAVYTHANPGLRGIVWESGPECPSSEHNVPGGKSLLCSGDRHRAGNWLAVRGRATLLFLNSAQLNCQAHPLLRRRLLGDQQRPGFAEPRRVPGAVPWLWVGRISETRCLAQNLGFLSSPNHTQLCPWLPGPGPLIPGPLWPSGLKLSSLLLFGLCQKVLTTGFTVVALGWR